MELYKGDSFWAYLFNFTGCRVIEQATGLQQERISETIRERMSETCGREGWASYLRIEDEDVFDID